MLTFGTARKKPVDVKFEIATEDGTIETTEGVMAYHAGDYLMTDHTGDGRRWPVDPAYFARHYDVVARVSMHGFPEDEDRG